MPYVKTNMHFFVSLEYYACSSHQVLIESKKVSNKSCIEKQKTHTSCPILYFSKSYGFLDS